MALSIHQLRFHRDYDGTVAAAMIVAAFGEPEAIVPVDYGEVRETWLAAPAPDGLAVVDFLYHPSAVLWVDHHSTTFLDPNHQRAFSPDAHHVFDHSAPSCPYLIIRQPWFPPHLRECFSELEAWANIIDAADYDSPEQATDLRNDHIALSRVLPSVLTHATAPGIVRALTTGTLDAALSVPVVRDALIALRADAAAHRRRVLDHTRTEGAVLFSDQSSGIPGYDRFLPFVGSEAAVLVGIYRTDAGFVVSVGANPWHRPEGLDIGALCRRHGGGGRQHTGGVATASLSKARALAGVLVRSLNAALSAPQAGHAIAASG